MPSLKHRLNVQYLFLTTCSLGDEMYEIYLITNLQNGKQYVGATRRSAFIRFKEHFVESKNVNSKSPLHHDMRKYGLPNFSLTILESGMDDSKICEREKYYISKYDTFKSGYNCTVGGSGVEGYKHTSVDIQKMSDSHKGHIFFF